MKKSIQQLKDLFYLNHLLLRLVSLLLLVIIFLPQKLIAQNDAETQEKIIEHCLTFQPLVDIIPAETKQQISGYLILDHGINFQFSTNFEINGKSVSLISKDERNSNKPYFDFFTLNIESGKAFTTYYFNYYIDNVEHTISVTIQFEKDNSVWKVINYTI